MFLILLFGCISCLTYQKPMNCTTYSEQRCNINGVRELKPFQYGGFLRTYNNGYNQQTVCPVQIIFYECEINFVPSKLFESCPSITYFDISFASVKYVSDYVFEGIVNVLHINMASNEIKELHDYTFMHGTNLKILELANNQLTKISNNTFNGLEKLLKLDLSNNEIVIVEAGSFKSLKILQEIHLYENFILDIDSTMFNRNPLKILDLANNQLTKFYFQTLSVNHLNKIDLSDNFLVEIDPLLSGEKMLLNNNNLTSLILLSPFNKEVEASNNQLSSIYFSTLVEKLKLSSNNLTDIRNLTNLTNLTVLDLSFNNISSINENSFSLLQNLEQLILANTNLSPFHFSTFSHQKLLKKFDISYNNLNVIDFDDFISMQKLEELYIDGNDLKEIKYDEINNNFPEIKIIGLSNNNWNCSYLTKMRKNIFLNKIQIHIDPVIYERNTTNIGGISCSDDKDIQEIIKRTIWKNITTPISTHSLVDVRSEQLNHKINSLMYQLSKLQDKDKILVEKLLDMEKKLIEIKQNGIEPQKLSSNDKENHQEQTNITDPQLDALIDEIKKLSSNIKENRGNTSGIVLVFLIISISSILLVYGVHLYMKKREIKTLSLSRTPILDNNL